MALEFKAVADAALSMAHTLLPQWLGGKRQGHEWVGESKANGGLGNSWCINLKTGAWGHFSGDQRGGDLVALYAELNHVSQVVALEQVADIVGVSDRPVAVLERRKPPTERPAEEIPLGAAEPLADSRLGLPVATHRYGTAFWVLRYERDGKKTFRPLTWRNGKWSRKAYPEPRPLYNLGDLMLRPDAPVLIVEGEKAADALATVLVGYVVMTWANGCNAVHKNDWHPLRGRDVLIWPDADEPGGKAGAAVAEVVSRVEPDRVRLITVDDHSDGWDGADAVAEGWDAPRIVTWAKPRVRVVFPLDEAPAAATASPAPGPPTTAAASLGDSAVVNWSFFSLDTNEGGVPHATLANASQILQMHPDYKGRIWLDSFRGRIYHTLRGPAPRPWTDSESRAVTARLQAQLRLPKLQLNLMQDAIQHAAECHARNSLTTWLDSLEWDGTERLQTWLADCLGVEHNEYSMAVARNWAIAMVARAFVPGSKMDNMPVLEGASGLNKTTFLETLGGEWYKSLSHAFGDKDFLQAIQGAWLIEIPDMTGFSRRDHTQILATITTRIDTYRASYGRYVEDHPRVAIFAATSETSDYLQDTRGRRRYWPLRCTAIDLDALRGQRDQIFAEAVQAYRDGAKWYEMPGEATDAEQVERATPDLWTDKVIDYASELWAEEKRTGRPHPITSSHILYYAIEMPLAKQGLVEKNRIARIMRENGWIQSRKTHTRNWIKKDRPALN